MLLPGSSSAEGETLKSTPTLLFNTSDKSLELVVTLQHWLNLAM